MNAESAGRARHLQSRSTFHLPRGTSLLNKLAFSRRKMVRVSESRQRGKP
jgi:hypothetical protein